MGHAWPHNTSGSATVGDIIGAHPHLFVACSDPIDSFMVNVIVLAQLPGHSWGTRYAPAGPTLTPPLICTKNPIFWRFWRTEAHISKATMVKFGAGEANFYQQLEFSQFWDI